MLVKLISPVICDDGRMLPVGWQGVLPPTRAAQLIERGYAMAAVAIIDPVFEAAVTAIEAQIKQEIPAAGGEDGALEAEAGTPAAEDAATEVGTGAPAVEDTTPGVGASQSPAFGMEVGERPLGRSAK